jgi:hypothetical protein
LATPVVDVADTSSSSDGEDAAYNPNEGGESGEDEDAESVEEVAAVPDVDEAVASGAEMEVESEQEHKRCAGFRHRLAPLTATAYPYGAHETAAFKWSMEMSGRVRHHDCKQILPIGGSDVCDKCALLESSPQLRKLLERAALPHTEPLLKRCRNDQLTHDQLNAKCKELATSKSVSRVKIYRLARRLQYTQKNLDSARQLLLHISKGNVSGAKRILATAFQQKRSLSYTLHVHVFQKAIDSNFRPRAGIDGSDIDLALLILRIGGRALLHTLQKTHGKCLYVFRYFWSKV